MLPDAPHRDERGSEDLFRASLDTMLDPFVILRAVRSPTGEIVDFAYEYANEAACAFNHKSNEEMLRARLLEQLPEHQSAELLAAHAHVVDTGVPLVLDDFAYDDSWGGQRIRRVVTARGNRVADGLTFTWRDVSEAKRLDAERERLRSQLMRIYGLLIAANSGIVRARTTDELFEQICHIAVETAGFSLAWIGLIDESSGLVKPVAMSGATSYVDGVRISTRPSDSTALGPTGTALREGRAVVCNEIASDPRFAPWRERALRYGFAASGAFPLLEDGTAIGVLSVYSPIPGFFTEEECALLGQLTSDLALAVRAKNQEAELASTQRFLQALTDSMAEGMFAIDDHDHVTYMNRAAKRMLGWGIDELRDRGLHAATHYQHADGSAYPLDECPLCRVRDDGVAIVVDDDVFMQKGGELLPVSFSAAPLIGEATSGVVVVFSDITARKAEERRHDREMEELSWVGRIRDALTENRFVLYAQPIVDIRSREVVSHELLLRLVDRNGQIVAPGAFLPAAERFGVIREIDLWVAAQAAQLGAAGHDVSFNLSGETLGHPETIGKITSIIRRSGVDPTHLICEITETALAHDPRVAEASVNEIANSGCRVALDDFGAGYGGFTYLKRLPVHHLKIDREFVHNIAENPQNQHVVKAVVNLAQGFGKKTVAEGIETDRTLELLRSYGVDYAQGYLLGRPTPVSTVFQ